MLRFTLPNGQKWRGHREDIMKSVGLNGFQKHGLLEALDNIDEAMLEVNEIHFRDGGLLELEVPTTQEEIDRGNF